jgi:hypothetical protein
LPKKICKKRDWCGLENYRSAWFYYLHTFEDMVAAALCEIKLSMSCRSPSKEVSVTKPSSFLSCHTKKRKQKNNEIFE